MKMPECHEAATLFPEMSKQEFEELKQNIREVGQLEPVVFYCGKLLDGRHRYKACIELGIEPDTSEIDEEVDPWVWSISHNLHRRHMDESQRSIVAGQIAKLKHGTNQFQQDGAIAPSIEKAAEMLNVSKDSVKRAKTVLKDGSDDLINAVKSGEVSVSKAARIAKTVPKEAQIAEARKPKPPAAKKANSKAADKPQGLPVKGGDFDIESATDRIYNFLRSDIFRWPKDQRPVAAEHILRILIDEFDQDIAGLLSKIVTE